MIGALDSLRLAISTTAPLPAQLAVDFAKTFQQKSESGSGYH